MTVKVPGVILRASSYRGQSMRWFILRVQGKKVKQVAASLEEGATWLPLERVMTKPAGKKSPVQSEKPMIPGWLFAQEHLYGKWDEIDGVFGPVRYGRRGVLWIEDADLDGLRQTERELNEPPRPLEAPRTANCPRPVVGSIVTVGWLLAGVSGRLEAYEGADTACVRVGGLLIKVHYCLLGTPAV